MNEAEINNLKDMYPLLSHVLRMIEQGESIKQESPYWDTYLIARQRGLVMRTGEDKSTIAVSPRGGTYQESSGPK